MNVHLTSNVLIDLLFVSLVDMIHLIGGIIILGLCLGFFERLSNRFLTDAFGMKGILITAWFGTPVHELSHAIMCFIFHHRVNKIKLLQVRSLDGILGYVEHQFNPGSLYQRIGNFFIGIAPLIGGAFTILLGMYFVVPDSYHDFIQYLSGEVSEGTIFQMITGTFTTIVFLIKSLFRFENFLNPLFWIFLFLAMCISSNMALSKADMKGATSGITSLFLLINIINGIARFMHIAPGNINLFISKVNIYVLTLIGIALIFALITVLISYLFSIIIGSVGKRF